MSRAVSSAYVANVVAELRSDVYAKLKAALAAGDLTAEQSASFDKAQELMRKRRYAAAKARLESLLEELS
ncbi:MAG: hypothetical protein AAGD96_19935 [Chloroflexota bacterium]